MGKFNIAIGPGDGDPEVLKGVISWEFELKTADAFKFLKKIQENNIVATMAAALSKAFEQESTKDE